VDAAEKVDPATLSSELFDLLHRLDPDHVASREHDRSLDAAFRASTLLDGWVKVDGLLPPTVGQALCAALAAARQRPVPVAHGDAARNGAVDGGRGGAHDGVNDNAEETAHLRTSRRNVDALAVILAAAASAEGDNRLPSVHGARPVLHVHVSAESLAQGTAPGWLETATGGRLVPVTAAAAERLSCDAVRQVLVRATDGTVDAISSRHRIVPGMMRRAILQRDNLICRFPGCSSGIHEVHHVVPWARGGLTVSSNLMGLCSFHHHLVHDGGWTVAGDANRVITLRSPRGRLSLSPLPTRSRRC
jgi:5-methylcytosine-specific restriction endonuclease McrA